MKRKQLAPGIYRGMSFDDYMAIEAVNHSLLEWAVTHTLEHFDYHAKAEPEPSTPDQAFGIVIHKAILEPGDFTARLEIGPINPTTKKTYGRGTKAWVEAEQNAGGQILVREDEYATIRGLRMKILEHGAVTHALRLPDRINECVAVWKDPETGVLCKGRADLFAPGTILLDLKSTTCAGVRSFGKDAANYGYHRQADWYAKGFPLAAQASDLDGTAVPVAFAAFEKDPPYGIALYTLPEGELAIARQENSEALAKVAEGFRTGHFPGYPKTVQPLSLPAWAVPHVESVS